MNKEIEIKIKIADNDLKKLKEWLKKNAKFTGSTAQTDYYLNNPKASYFYLSNRIVYLYDLQIADIKCLSSN